MISLQNPKEDLLQESLHRKRKRADPAEEVMMQQQKNKSMAPNFDPCLQNPASLPPEWQRCLDIKSGRIYYYNTRTKMRDSGDPNPKIESPNSAPMSLELELNLPCQPLGSNQAEDSYKKQESEKIPIFLNNPFKSSGSTKGLSRSPSWLTFEGDEQEMVTAVCKKCYMLVMMSKSSPACPNCKYMHPSEPTPDLFNQSLSLLC